MWKKVVVTIPSPRTGVYIPLLQVPGIQLVFMGAAACIRHKALEMDYLMTNKQIAIMTLDEADFVTGKYLSQAASVIKRICDGRNPTGIVLLTGCQCALLSTDYSLITDQIEKDCNIKVMALNGCYLCNFEDTKSEGMNTYEEVLFGFLMPSRKSSQPMVNVLSAFPLSAENELFQVLNKAGISSINMLSNVNTPEEYQQMSKAHLNIICTDHGAALGEYLQSRLDIPFVVFPREPDPKKITEAYDAVAQKLGVKLETDVYQEKVKEELAKLHYRFRDYGISVNGNLACARWLFQEGFSVEKVSFCPWETNDNKGYKWFQENAPKVQVVNVLEDAEMAGYMFSEVPDSRGCRCGYQLCSSILKKLEDSEGRKCS